MKVPLATFGASVKSIGAGPTAGSAIANAVYSIVPGIDASGLTLYSAVMLGAALGLLVQLTFVSRTVAFYKKLAELEILVHTNRMTKKRALEVRDELETRSSACRRALNGTTRSREKSSRRRRLNRPRARIEAPQTPTSISASAQSFIRS
jgi:hypothetical protein